MNKLWWLALLLAPTSFGQSANQAGPAYTPTVSGGSITPGSVPLSALQAQSPGTVLGTSTCTGSTQISPSAVSAPCAATFNATSTTSIFQYNGTTLAYVGGPDFTGEYTLYYGLGAGAGAVPYNAGGGKDYATCMGEDTCGGAGTGMLAQTTNSENSAFGWRALSLCTTCAYDTAIGVGVLRYETTGSNNTGVGTDALGNTGTGVIQSVAVGVNALGYGVPNASVAIGNFAGAGVLNATQTNIVAIGYNAMIGASMTTPNSDIAIGAYAFNAVTGGVNDIAIGHRALNGETSGSNNTAVGFEAGYTQTGEGYNNFFGANAGKLVTGQHNAIFGGSSSTTILTTGGSDTILGYNCEADSTNLTSGISNIVSLCAGSTSVLFISGAGTPATSAAKFLGTLALPAIATGTNADFVCMTSGFVFVIQSSACTISSLRFKENVEDLSGSAMPEISKMEVASYNLKDTHNKDPNATSRQTGLIAENIAQVAPECAIYEDDMKTPKSYRQECVIALLVKATQEQAAEIKRLKRRIH